MVNDSRLLKGTLTFGPTGTEASAEGQTTNLIIEQQDGDTEDQQFVLSGDAVGGETTPGPWHVTGTMIQDFDASPSLQQWSLAHAGTWQEFTFTPNDNTNSPTVTGEVYVKFLGIGGDVKSRITRDFDWSLRGPAGATDPDFGTWGSAAVAATEATAGTPGNFLPAGASAPADLAAMAGVTATPATAWTTGQYVVLGDASNAHWDGAAWAAGMAP
jgi:hypothetical protein